MTRASLRRAFGLALLAAAALGAASRPAHAEPPSAKATPVYVLSLWTDDADDQADALTQALRSRVRQAQGWSLLETPQSFETLAIALKCPPKPDAPCLQRIADQLHADHYVWGTMARKKGAGEVTADVHLWSRGKGDADANETYTDNLKDASDESLRQIAARLFGKLTGGAPPGRSSCTRARPGAPSWSTASRRERSRAALRGSTWAAAPTRSPCASPASTRRAAGRRAGRAGAGA